MSPTFASVLTILIGMYGLRLAYAGQLVYYIHPRYVILTTVACVVVVVVGIIAFALSPVAKQTRRRTARGIVGMLPVIAFVGIGILLPAKALSSASVEQRSTSVMAPQQPASEEDITSGVTDVSTLDTSEWTFDDFWYSLMIQDRVLEHYNGKTVNVLGFVSHPKSSPEAMFHLTRFLMMCCAIDAQTVGFWVQEDEILETSGLKDDAWVQVKGTFRLSEWNGKKTLVIEPETIEPTGQPEDPYVY